MNARPTADESRFAGDVRVALTADLFGFFDVLVEDDNWFAIAHSENFKIECDRVTSTQFSRGAIVLGKMRAHRSFGYLPPLSAADVRRLDAKARPREVAAAARLLIHNGPGDLARADGSPTLVALAWRAADRLVVTSAHDYRRENALSTAAGIERHLGARLAALEGLEAARDKEGALALRAELRLLAGVLGELATPELAAFGRQLQMRLVVSDCPRVPRPDDALMALTARPRSLL